MVLISMREDIKIEPCLQVDHRREWEEQLHEASEDHHHEASEKEWAL